MVVAVSPVKETTVVSDVLTTASTQSSSTENASADSGTEESSSDKINITSSTTPEASNNSSLSFSSSQIKGLTLSSVNSEDLTMDTTTSNVISVNEEAKSGPKHEPTLEPKDSLKKKDVSSAQTNIESTLSSTASSQTCTGPVRQEPEGLF